MRIPVSFVPRAALTLLRTALALPGAALILLCASVLPPRLAIADVPEVHTMLLDARARFAEGKDAEAITLLQQLIEHESGEGDNGVIQEGALCGCAHRDLALHFAKLGDRARAQKEAKKALAAGFTDEFGTDCVVIPWEPELQRLQGGPPKSEALAKHTLPQTAYLTRISPTECLTDSGAATYLIDRKKKTRTAFLRMAGSPIYRIAPRHDGEQLLLEWEDSNALLEVQRSPFRIRYAPLPIGMRASGSQGPIAVDLIIPEGDDGAVLYDGVGVSPAYFSVFRTRFDGVEPPQKLATINGWALRRRLDRVVFLRYVPHGRTTVSPLGYVPESDAIVERDLATGKERVVYAFAKVDQESWAFAVAPALTPAATPVPGSTPREAATPDRPLTLVINDHAAGKVFVLVDEQGQRPQLVRALPAALPKVSNLDDVALGLDGKTLLVADRTGRTLTLFDPAQDAVRTIELAKGCAKSRGGDEPVNLGLGAWKDGTLWLHRGNELILVDGQGGQRCVDLKAFVADKAPEWANAHYAFADPDELWFGIESGKFRKFIWLGWAELWAAAL